MLDRHIDQPIPLALLALAGAVAAPGILLALRRARPISVGPTSVFTVLGAIQLAALWLVLIPLNVFDHLTGAALAFIFGSEAQPTSLVDYLVALNLAGAIVLGLRLGFSASTSRLVRALSLSLAILFGFTALEEVGLDDGLLSFAFPTDQLAAGLVPSVYAAGGLIMIVGALVCLVRSSVRLARGSINVSGVEPFAISLFLTSGMLLQHLVFEEVSELAFSAAVLQALIALTLRSRASAETRTQPRSCGRKVAIARVIGDARV